jgi:hypothetical protein
MLSPNIVAFQPMPTNALKLVFHPHVLLPYTNLLKLDDSELFARSWKDK